MINIRDIKKSSLYILVLIFVIQAFLFYGYYSREIEPFHPEGWDQVVYYNNSFQLYESILRRDFNSFVDNFIPNGTLLQFMTAISFFLTGDSRLNGIFIILLLWMATAFFIYRFFERRSDALFGLAMLGLFFSTKSYYNIVGGLVDYRLDVPGGLLYGISLMLLIESQKLTISKYKNLFFIISLCSIILRPNLIMFFIPIALAYTIYLLFSGNFKLENFVKVNLSVKLTLLLSVLYFITIWKKFDDYYGISRIFIKEEGVKTDLLRTMYEAMGVNPHNALSFHLYYVLNFVKEHLGKYFIFTFGLLIIIFVVVVLQMTTSDSRRVRLINYRSIAQEISLPLLYIIIPFILYTVNPSKNPVVATTMLVPFLILIGNILSQLYNVYFKNGISKQSVASILALSFLLVGLFNFITFSSSTRGLSPLYGNTEKMAADVNSTVIGLRSDNTKISFLDFNEMNPQLLSFYGFLDEKRIVHYKTLMPQGYSLPSEQDIINAILHSDIVIINSMPGNMFAPLSFNHNSTRYIEVAMPIINDSFVRLEKEYNTIWGKYNVYLKPSVILANPYKDWLSDIFYIDIQEVYLGDIGKITISGNAQTYLEKSRDIAFDVFLYKKGLDYPSHVKPALVKFEGEKYMITVELPKDEEISQIKFTASHFFVPLELKINEDTRKLVLPYPQEIKVEKQHEVQ